MSCSARELDADSATSVRLTQSGVTKALRREALQVAFPHHVGLQEQIVKLAPGDWLVDWPGAATIGRLRVSPGVGAEVRLLTTNGRCRLQEKRCELDGKRLQQITVRVGAEAGSGATAAVATACSIATADADR